MTWWRRLISRDRLEDQLDSELRDHFERLVAEYRQQGHADVEARRLARLEFGGLDQVKEACRDVRGTRWIDDTVQDIRHGVRGFLKTPGFTAVAVLTLALGIGANLAIFNVLDALLLRPLPVPNASRLVTLTRWIENNSSESFSYPQIRALADRSDLFASLCGIGGGTLFTRSAGRARAGRRGLCQRQILRDARPHAVRGTAVECRRRSTWRPARGGHHPQLLDAPFRR